MEKKEKQKKKKKDDSWSRKSILCFIPKEEEIYSKKWKIYCYEMGLNMNHSFTKPDKNTGWGLGMKWVCSLYEIFGSIASDCGLEPKSFIEHQLNLIRQKVNENRSTVIKQSNENNERLSNEVVSDLIFK